MRERFKCPFCGLVQWREEVCKRCGYPSDEGMASGPGTPAAAADQPAPAMPAYVPVGAGPGESSGGTDAPQLYDDGLWMPTAPIPDVTMPDELQDRDGAARPWLSGRLVLAAVAAAVVLAVAFTLWRRPDRVVFPGNLTLEDLNQLCPFESGTFICQHTQALDGTVRSVTSKKPEDDFEIVYASSRIHVRSRSKKIGLAVRTRGFDQAVWSFLSSGGALLDYREHGAVTLDIAFGDLTCEPYTARVYRTRVDPKNEITSFFADLVMRCQDETWVAGRVCVNCRGVKETAAQINLAPPPPPPRLDRLSMSDAYRLCRVRSVSMICLKFQDASTSEITEVREDNEFIEFTGDMNEGFSVVGESATIQALPASDQPLVSRHRYSADADEQLAYLDLRTPECPGARTEVFEVSSRPRIAFEVTCRNGRHVVGLAVYERSRN